VAASAIRHQYLEEMRHAFEALVDQIERIVHPQGNVLPDGPGGLVTATRGKRNGCSREQ